MRNSPAPRLGMNAPEGYPPAPSFLLLWQILARWLQRALHLRCWEWGGALLAPYRHPCPLPFFDCQRRARFAPARTEVAQGSRFSQRRAQKAASDFPLHPAATCEAQPHWRESLARPVPCRLEVHWGGDQQPGRCSPLGPSLPFPAAPSSAANRAGRAHPPGCCWKDPISEQEVTSQCYGTPG
jgi:hypothetical protein